MGFLQGKRLLITGVLSNRSIAYGIAQACRREGAELAFTYVGERFKERITEIAAEFDSDAVYDMDVTDDGQIDAAFAALRERWDGLDGLVHSIEFQATPETTVGSGTPSDWPGGASPDPLTRAVFVPAWAGDASTYLIAPNGDGRLWYWRARAYRSSTEYSNWTAVLSIQPTFDGSTTTPSGPSGSGIIDGGTFATVNYPETLDGGAWDTVYSQTVDAGGW